MELVDLLKLTIESKASDLIITAGTPPMLRVDGVMAPVASAEVMSPDMCRTMIYAILTDAQKARFEGKRSWIFL